MTNDYLSHFKFIGHGTWVNDELDACISLNEDYKRTFRAYLSKRPHPYTVVTSPKGAATRFRSAEAAAERLFSERGEFRKPEPKPEPGNLADDGEVDEFSDWHTWKGNK